jgi:hypothetical protein
MSEYGVFATKILKTAPRPGRRVLSTSNYVEAGAGYLARAAAGGQRPRLSLSIRLTLAPMSEHAYRVVVTREDGQWLADIPELRGGHTYARILPTLDQAVREVIVLAGDLPDEAMPEVIVDYDYHTGDPDLDEVTGEVRRLRRQADELAAVAAARTGQVAVKLVARGLSVRDAAALLGISSQRVSQLTARTG